MLEIGIGVVIIFVVVIIGAIKVNNKPRMGEGNSVGGELGDYDE